MSAGRSAKRLPAAQAAPRQRKKLGNAEFSAVNCRFDGAGREFFARVVKSTLQFMPDGARGAFAGAGQRFGTAAAPGEA
jgi:hypothetical protein